MSPTHGHNHGTLNKGDESGKPFVRRVSRKERLLSVALLALLPVVAVLVYVKGQRYDSRLFALDPALLEPSADTGRAATPAPEVEPQPPNGERRAPFDTGIALLPRRIEGLGWEADGGVETFSARNLYEKINGRAEQYLQYGARKLHFISYVEEDGPQFIDLFVYDMGTPQSASAIYALEKPSQALAVSLGREGYRVEASYFFWHERYYVQVIAGDVGRRLEQAGLKLARAVETNIRGTPANSRSTGSSP
ncbi:MAG: DUF6599 family protein [Acidobacteriota bacterium]